MSSITTAPPGGDTSLGPGLIAIFTVFGVFSTATSIIRLTVRSATRRFGWDDFFIAFATLLQLSTIVILAIAVHHGLGRHVFYLTPHQKQLTLMWDWMYQPILFVILCVTKISICLFTLRIRHDGWLKWTLYTLMAGQVISTLPCFIVLFAQCRPIQATWNPKAGKCWDTMIYKDLVWFQVSYCILSDVACSLLPILVLRKVRMAPRLKIAACLLMSLGLLATICSIVRAVLSAPDAANPDGTYTRTYIVDWANAELNLGIICANLALSPTCYRFIKSGGKTADKDSQPSVKQRSRILQSKGYHSYPRSQDDEIPLQDSSIKKTLDVRVENEERKDSHAFIPTQEMDARYQADSRGEPVRYPGEGNFAAHVR